MATAGDTTEDMEKGPHICKWHDLQVGMLCLSAALEQVREDGVQSP